MKQNLSLLSMCRHSPFFAVVAVVLASVVSPGCAGTGGLVSPEVTLVDIELVDVTLFESTYRAAVRVTNHNPEPLLIDGAVIELVLDGRTFGRGSSGDRLEIGRLDSAVVPVKMHLSHVAIASKLREVLENRAVPYTIDGHIFVERTTGGRWKLPIDKEGVIDLQAAQDEDAPVDSTVDEGSS